MLLMENNSGAFLLADPISEHSSFPLLFFMGYLHGNKSPVSQLLIWSCCLPFLNRRQTFQRGCFQANSPEWQNRAHQHLPEPERQYQARDTPCAQTASHLLVIKAAEHTGRVHWETFRTSSMENKSLMLRRSNCVGCSINHQPGKALLTRGTPKFNTDIMRLRLLQKKQPNSYCRFRFCSCPWIFL